MSLVHGASTKMMQSTYHFLLGLSLVVVIHSDCPSPQESYLREDGSGYVCCLPLTCPEGHQARMCSDGDPSGFCERCPHNKFRKDISILGNHDRCFLKRTCDEPYMIYKSLGNETTDNVCDCLPGYHWSNPVCLPDVPPPTPPPECSTQSATSSPDDTDDQIQRTMMIYSVGGVIVGLIIAIIWIFICYKLKKKFNRGRAKERQARNNTPDPSSNGSLKPLLYGQEMSKDDQQKISANKPYLLENMSVDPSFLAYLTQYKTITDYHKEQINAKRTSHGKNDAFLDILVKRGPLAFDDFLKALYRSQQEHIAKKLDPNKLNKIMEELHAMENGAV